MSISVVCPHCGGKLLAPSQLQGRMAKCPQCGQTVKVIQTKANTASCEPVDKHTECGTTVIGDPSKDPSMASPSSRSLYGLVCAGSALGLALLFGGWWLGQQRGVFSRFASVARQNNSPDAASVAGPAKSSEQTGLAGPESAESEASWADASKGPLQHGAVRVQLAAVTIRNIKMRNNLGEETVSATKYLTLSIRIVNASRHTVDFLGWSAPESQVASLKDDSGNLYQPLRLYPGAQIPGQVCTATSLDPDKLLEDLQVFEAPVDRIQFLRLELPAAAFGETGCLRFQIPKVMILH